MSLENEDQGSPGTCEKFDVVLKKPTISYSREFLLSLSNLDICKKLPSGFDESLLSEFEDASQSIPDRPRIAGSLPLQGFRRNEYGSSPPTQGGSGNYSRGNHGKWESRSSGWSDRDSDSQSDRDSDSGRRFGHQSRQSWQTHEHDGLLGSGSFPRPLGYAAGMSAPKVRANEHYQLSKTNEPYHPPRPYKAVPHSRRDTDSCNDETFGSMECTSEDRVEEERKRRASFEMMRKVQQKILQEKQKLNLEKHKEGGASDLGEVLDDSKEEKELFVRNNEMWVSAAIPITSNDLEKSSFASNSPASRPLVPPGFKNNILDKSSGLKALTQTPLSEVWKPLTGVSLLESEADLVQSGIKDGLERQLSQEISLADGQPGEKIQHAHHLNKDENVNSRTSLNVGTQKLDIDDQLDSSHLDSHGTLVELDAKVLEDKTVGNSNSTYSISILENFFGSTLSMNDGGSSSAENHDSKPDDTWRPNSVQSSKFSQWFFEEETKPADDMSSGRPNDLLSLIVSGDKVRYQVSDSETAEHFPPDFSFKTLEQAGKLKLDMPSAAIGISDQVCMNNNEEAIPTVLTCEDLEQSILSEYSAKNTNMQPVLQTSGANAEQPSGHVDGHASLHLLSLLHKGTDQSNTTLNSGLDINLADKLLISREYDIGTALNEPKCEENSKNIPNSVNALTLETLFGTSFMKELQSVEAPVSVQRGSTASDRLDAPEPHGLSLPVTDNDIFSPTIDKIGLQRPSHDYSVLSSNNKHQTKLSKAHNWRGFDDSQIEITSSKDHTEAVPKHGEFQGVSEFQLPEEKISVTDPRHHWMSTFLPTSNNLNSSSDGPIDIMNKLAAINAVKDQQVMAGSESLHFTRGPHEQLEPEIPYFTRGPHEQLEPEIPYRSLQMQQSLPQFQPPQIAQRRQLYHHLEPHPAHTSSQMKFLGPEPIFNHDSPANHHFPSNINRPPFPHHNVRIAGFEVPSHHPNLHQQMQVSGNRPPYMLPDFSRSGAVSHHGNQATAFMQETNQMQSFLFGPRAPGHGVPIPASDTSSGGNPPEAFQRLIEMELRANSKQTQPFAPGPNQGNHGHEVNMGFRYR